ncbi:MAG: cation diffusion facilitator family transporter [Gammaproteobacteria bacterium]|nr:cation diffusion facilitator family transporter [Gammaproteobacteria bacterium]NIR82589.1 cation diffusion facilitator family transporter [Gammaproteobacteria bacterium]NIR88792.1 cation diffusion facilitator family transporter [Gammaproteobacteria bacterium]NIV73997.1 cation diffusion facilitator family transporter [Gammaproteobacteria bacterium]
MWLTAAFMVVEAAGGLLAGSLALLADAGHMLTDTAALSFAWIALRLSRRPADRKRSYGYHRFQVLAAFVNGMVLLGIVIWIGFEAVHRLQAPVEVLGGLMLAVACGGLAVNLVVLRILRSGERPSLNVRGAALHVFGDLLGSVAAITAAGVILATGWTPIDPLLSLVVALLILRSAWHLVRQSGHILLEGTPGDLDLAQLRSELIDSVAEVDDVHHMHAWSLTDERPLVTLHAHIVDGADQQSALRRIKRLLRDRFGISHATVQIERGRCADDHGRQDVERAHRG